MSRRLSSTSLSQVPSPSPGTVRIENPSAFHEHGLTAARTAAPPTVLPEPGHDGGGFVFVEQEALRESGGPVLPLAPALRWLALVRRNMYWMAPVFGKKLGDIPGETQFLLIEHEDGRLSLVLPLIDGDLRFSLRGGEAGVHIVADGDIPNQSAGKARVAYVSEGKSPFRMIENSISSIARELGTFVPRREKVVPAFADHFGWCTWNAFYDRVDAAKIREGLESWKARDLLPGLLIVDDGWQDRLGDYLNDFPPSATAFPEGLSAVTRLLKEEYGLKMFGIWHAFQGYWGGVNPAGPLARRFRTVANRGKIRPWDGGNDEEKDLFLVHPEEAARFFAEFYHMLRSEGVDFVKVDGQSATEVFSRGVLGRVGVMRAFQQAFQAAGVREFGTEILHCMAHGNDVIWHCHATNAMRSSDDYRPQHDDSWQQQHIQDNAYNALFIGQVALPDWDMFQSHRTHSSYHAAARAISGGPIYVSDEPGAQDERLIEKLVWFKDGTARALRCPAPATVTRDRLLIDCRREKRLLKIFNSVNGIGLLGLFHVSADAEPVADTFCASDIEGIEGESFAIWRHGAGSLCVAERGQILEQSLPFMGWELAAVSPIREGVAILGLLDKFNAPAGIRAIARDAHSLAFDVLDGGRVGLVCERTPVSAELNGRPVAWDHDAGSRLLVVTAPARRSSSLRFAFG